MGCHRRTDFAAAVVAAAGVAGVAVAAAAGAVAADHGPAELVHAG